MSLFASSLLASLVVRLPLTTSLSADIFKEFTLWLAVGVKGLFSENATRRTLQNYINTFFALWQCDTNIPIPPTLRNQIQSFISSADLRMSSKHPGAIMESTLYPGSNEALTCGNIQAFVIPNPENPPHPFIAIVVLWIFGSDSEILALQSTVVSIQLISGHIIHTVGPVRPSIQVHNRLNVEKAYIVFLRGSTHQVSLVRVLAHFQVLICFSIGYDFARANPTFPH
ncbi:hypothetical protein C8R43DRAFT_944464 [Mycena crocata]|nr:hypothetical protein C8R43DRAFT_944464 [Mycena crocata]